jgi:hypothetical protein
MVQRVEERQSVGSGPSGCGLDVVLVTSPWENVLLRNHGRQDSHRVVALVKDGQEEEGEEEEKEE